MISITLYFNSTNINYILSINYKLITEQDVVVEYNIRTRILINYDGYNNKRAVFNNYFRHYEYSREHDLMRVCEITSWMKTVGKYNVLARRKNAKTGNANITVRQLIAGARARVNESFKNFTGTEMLRETIYNNNIHSILL